MHVVCEWPWIDLAGANTATANSDSDVNLVLILIYEYDDITFSIFYQNIGKCISYIDLLALARPCRGWLFNWQNEMR